MNQLGLSGSRIARTVSGQRAFDATSSTITMGNAGLDRQRGLFGDWTVQRFFAEIGARAGSAGYATPDDGGATLLDVYYAPDGLRASTILHESLHAFFGEGIPDDPELARRLGISREEFDAGGHAIDSALERAGCK